MRLTREPLFGDFVTLPVPSGAQDYAALRDFGDDTDRFLKRIAARQGEVICASGTSVRIGDGAPMQRQSRDAAGRTLPSWEGCQLLGPDEIFLLGATRDSFDGRYWGPTRVEEIDGVWRRL